MDQGLKEPPAVTAVGVPGAAAPGAGGICAVGEVITTSGLSKTFPGDIHAVVSLDLRVQSGEIFGLLGPNGAGKTTTVGMLSTRVIPTAGSACVGGVDVVAHPALAKQMIGVVAQSNTLDRSLTVSENLYYHCRYFGASARDARARADELLEQFCLADRAKSSVYALSGGMAQRLMVARSIAHRPHILFLDEPTAGLDPQSRLALWEILHELHGVGLTVLLTTHYMEEADHLCDRVATMVHDRHTVAQVVGLLHVVRGEQYREAHAVQLVQDLPERQPALRVQTGRRLVEEEDVRAMGDAARDHEALGHAAGQRVHARLGAVGQAELLQQLVGASAGVAGARAEIPAVVVQILRDGQAAVEGVGLRHDADHLLGQRRMRDDVDAAHAGAACRRDHARRQHADGGGLTGAVRPEQAEDLARLHAQVERHDGMDVAGERLREPARGDDLADGADAARSRGGGAGDAQGRHGRRFLQPLLHAGTSLRSSGVRRMPPASVWRLRHSTLSSPSRPG